MEDYDVIVVGLGIVGLGTTYYLSKRGLKVLGLEQCHSSGAIGSSSYGHTRIWRYSHTDSRYTKMMQEAQPLWKEIEERTGTKLFYDGGLLDVGDPADPEFKKLLSQDIDGEVLPAGEIMKRWPALQIPQEFKGFYSKDGGITMSKQALDSL